jgi:geranylgeranyl diphosphate synthase type II
MTQAAQQGARQKAAQQGWEKLLAEIEVELRERVNRLDGPDALREAVSYAVLGRGKRLRPVLTLLACEAVGGDRRRAHGAAAALELIHTFSLVHDDLPAMDDDQLRRGRPTLHVHAGEAMAILAGDSMLALAFSWLAEPPTPGATVGALVTELAGATGRMIAGQVYDTLGGFPKALGPQERLETIHRLKTAALLRAACRMGAVCGGASPEQLRALGAYGDAVGMMFQIVDDLLDVTQTAEHIGKATGKDHEAGKLTYPTVHGQEASRAAVERLRRRAHESLTPLGDAAGPLVELCDYMAVRTK